MKRFDPQKSRLIKNPDLLVKEEDEDGALVFNPDTDKVLVLNPSALFIWRRCDGNARLGDLVAGVCHAFSGVPKERVGEEVRGFIEKMVAEGFLGIVEEREGICSCPA